MRDLTKSQRTCASWDSAWARWMGALRGSSKEMLRSRSRRASSRRPCDCRTLARGSGPRTSTASRRRSCARSPRLRRRPRARPPTDRRGPRARPPDRPADGGIEVVFAEHRDGQGQGLVGVVAGGGVVVAGELDLRQGRGGPARCPGGRGSARRSRWRARGWRAARAGPSSPRTCWTEARRSSMAATRVLQRAEVVLPDRPRLLVGASRASPRVAALGGDVGQRRQRGCASRFVARRQGGAEDRPGRRAGASRAVSKSPRRVATVAGGRPARSALFGGTSP